MGFVDSVFGSSSKTEKKTKVNTTTTINTKTDTKTNIRDIGFTGNQAIMLADTVANQTAGSLGNVALLQAKGFDALLNTSTVQTDRAYNLSEKLLESSSRQSERTITSAGNLLTTAKNQSENIMAAASTLTKTETENLLPYVLVAIVGVVFAMRAFN